MKKLMLLVTAVVSIGCVASGVATTTQASGPKIAIVDPTSVILKSPQIAFAKNKLNQEFKQRRTKLNNERVNIKNLTNKLNKDGITMQASEQKKLHNQLTRLEKQFIMDGQKLQADYNTQRKKYIPAKTLLINLETAIKKVAVKDNYDLVISKGVVAYSQPGPFVKDITPEVSVAFNKMKLGPLSSAQGMSSSRTSMSG